MPEIDLTISITSVLAICAIVSPILTACINNAHNTKIKKLELKEEKYRNTVLHKRDIYENYLKTAGRCIYYADSDALKDFGEYHMQALVWADDELFDKMTNISKLMYDEDWRNSRVLLEEIAPLIHEKIEKL